MLSPHHIQCCLLATLTICVHARATDPHTPDPADAVNAYLAARPWIDTFTPPAAEDEAAAVPLSQSHGLRIQLRRQGRLLGRGQVIAPDTGLNDRAVRLAVARALGDVLSDPTVQDLSDTLRAGIGRSLTLELEIAGVPQPMVGGTYAQIASQIEPGIDGIAMRRGDDWTMLFPSDMLATNTASDIERVLPSVVAELGLQAMELAPLMQRFGLTVYRFRTVHLVQRDVGASPTSMMRGQSLVSDLDVTPESIVALADGLAAHLLRSRWSSIDAAAVAEGVDPAVLMPRSVDVPPLGMRGTYMPRADAYRPMFASPLEQALAAMALGTYAQTPGVPPERAAAAEKAAADLLHALAIVEEAESDPRLDPVAAAAVVYAASVVPGSAMSGAANDLATDVRMRLWTVRVQESGALAWTDTGTGQPRTIRPEQTGIVAGLARLLPTDAATWRVELTRRAIDAVWALNPGGIPVDQFPWLGWAELDYARAIGVEVANASLMQFTRNVLMETQIDGEMADLAGALPLQVRGQLRATSQCVRPGAFLATMLADERLTPSEGAMEYLGRHLRLMRFLQQLAIGEDDLWACRAPERALGGLRAATWDADQPVAAQALGLILAAETLRALDRLGMAAKRP